MKTSLIFYTILGAIFFTSCKPDEPIIPPTPTSESFQVSIKPNLEGTPYSLNDEFINVMNYRISFSDLKFYLGDIYLLKANGDSVELSRIEFFHMAEGSLVKTFSIPNGEYTGITYSWGVPIDFGGTDNPDFDPTVYGPNHPLNLDNGMYWSWNSGYRFAEVEGRFDIDPEGTDPLLNTFAYHPGTHALYRTITLDLPITLDGVGSTQFNINLDLKKMFYNDTMTLDPALATENDLAGGNVETLGVKFMELFMGAIDHNLQ